MKSMTGFGESSAPTEIGRVLVDIRSENHRFLDVKVIVPEHLVRMESAIDDIIKNCISRGRLKLRLSVQTNQKEKQKIVEKRMRENYESLRKISSDLGLRNEIRIEHLIMMENQLGSSGPAEISEKAEATIKDTVRKALERFDRSREVEGKKLEKTVLRRMEAIKESVTAIRKERKAFVKKSEKKTKEKTEKLFSSRHRVDPLFYHEAAAIITEKTEIDEEIVRLGVHLSKFRKTAKKKGIVGKELDFLLQEMNREAGTISAKCKDAEISHLTIRIRLELEKIREQIQNIE